jgi:hypothetical protein
MENKKYPLKESASFQPVEKKEREKSDFEDFITKLLGKIFLTKTSFFGLDTQKIVIIVTPSYKIASVVAAPKKWIDKLPQKRQETLNPELIINWAQENGFEISFNAETPKLKSKLLSSFGDVMVDHTISESVNSINLTEEINNSGLPEFVKQWALDNPEKFKSNINEIKRLLS